MTANEELNRIQKGLKNNLDRIKAIPIINGGSVFVDGKQILDRKEKERILSISMPNLFYDNVIVEINKTFQQIQSETDKLQDKIEQLCNNIDTLEANKDAYKEQCKEQEKEFKRLDHAFDELYKLKEALRKGLEEQEREIERKNRSLLLKSALIKRLRRKNKWR